MNDTLPWPVSLDTPTGALLAIDPGTNESGWVILDADNRVAAAGIHTNHQLLTTVARWNGELAIEMIASYGMPVGREVFETCLWVGRFIQAYPHSGLVRLVYRQDVKTHLCHSSSATDTNIRVALIDLIGPTGTKKNPGPTYGISKHMWAALAVAATVRELQPEGITA